MAGHGPSHHEFGGLSTLPPTDVPEASPPHDSKFRKLKLRKARFQGRKIAAPDMLSSSPPAAATSNDASSSPINFSISSPSNRDPVSRNLRRTSSPLGSSPGALHELSGPNILRRHNQKPELDVVPLGDNDASDENRLGRTSRHSSIPVKISRPNKAARASTGSRRSISGGESKYIEHLESQLASMQTQLQSLTSPSSTRSHSAKLRAMNAESKLLRQEIAEWELKFNERVQEQMEEHDILTTGLRSNIRALERNLEESHSRVNELLVESELKSKSLVAIESANYELERRVEFLSDLLASSPNKIDIFNDAEPRPFRTRSIPPPRLFSPERSKRLSINTKISGPFSPIRRSDSRASNFSSLDPPLSAGASDENAPQMPLEESDEPDSPTIIEGHEHPAQRFSWMKNKASDSQSRKPNRKMRRFYTGAMGPRALILPATTHGGSMPTSACSPPTPCPPHGHGLNTHSLSDIPIHLLATHTERGRGKHRRSATWDPDDRSAFIGRRLTLNTPRSIPIASPQTLPSSSGMAFSQESERSKTMRLLDTGSNDGRNLFDEIGNGHFDASSEFGGSLPGTGVEPLLSEASYVSSLSEPSLEPAKPHRTAEAPNQQQLTLFASSPHSQNANISINALASQSGGMFHILSTLFSRSLRVYSASARTVISNAWFDTALSRPVVEFRWWLIRILVGRMRYKSTVRSHPHPTSQGLGLGLAASPVVLPSPPWPSKDDDPALLPEHSVLAYGEAGPPSPLLAPEDHSQHAYASTKQNRSLPVVTWLKFSVTLLFAVGIAIRDGPGGLFRDQDGEDDLLAIQHTADTEPLPVLENLKSSP